MEKNYIIHYGILGQKWGVRRSEKQLARIRKKADKNDWSDDAKTAAEIKTKKLKQMSNSDLKKINERTRLEQEYTRLKKSKSKSAGRKFVEDVVTESSKELAKEYTKKYTKAGIELVGPIVKSNLIAKTPNNVKSKIAGVAAASEVAKFRPKM